MTAPQPWIALLRGINVGGNNILPMAELRGLLSGLGYHDPKTYIQSGNCVFAADGSAATISGAITRAIEQQFGFAPQVLTLTPVQLRTALEGNPYAGVESALKTVHLFFMVDAGAAVDTDRINTFKAASEDITVTKGVIYLHAPDGVGRSKLVAKIDSCIDTPITARNLNSVTKILALAQKL